MSGGPRSFRSRWDLVLPSLGVALLSLLLASPRLSILADAFMGRATENRFDSFAAQVVDPFTRDLEGGFLAFRILLPGLLHVLGLPAWAGYVAVVLAGVALIALVLRHVMAAGLPPRTAVALGVCLACTPVLQGSHFYVGYPDTVSWLILGILMGLRAPWAWAPLVVAGMFNDERLLLGVPLAAAFLLREHREDLRRLVGAAVPYAAATAGGVVVWLLGREGIRRGLLGGAPVADTNPHEGFFPLFGLPQVLGTLIAFTALWAVLALAVRGDGRAGRPFWMSVLAYLAVATYVTAWAADLWRGLAAVFPVFVLAAVVLHERDPARSGRVLGASALLMALTPQLEQMGPLIRWMRPLPVAVVEWVTDGSVLDLLGVRGLLP